ncbi:MAG: TetR/AcrR family transcriptional regulator [Chloroflexi bacterium]|nr:TetR/AcrR family transcriptional regulator [Chloroflexota bacterium]
MPKHTPAATRPRRQTGSPSGVEGPPRLELVREAARTHFAERGYEAASMRDIAASAGIRISTLYFHCTTKEQLLFDVLQDSMVELASGLKARIEEVGPSWTERLAAAIAFHVQYSAERAFGTTVNRTDMNHLSPAHRAEYLAMRDSYEHQFRDLVRGGIESGELRPVDPKLTVFAIIGTGLTVGRWYRPDGPLTPEEIGRAYVDLLLHALRPARS